MLALRCTPLTLTSPGVFPFSQPSWGWSSQVAPKTATIWWSLHVLSMLALSSLSHFRPLRGREIAGSPGDHVRLPLRFASYCMTPLPPVHVGGIGVTRRVTRGRRLTGIVCRLVHLGDSQRLAWSAFGCLRPILLPSSLRSLSPDDIDVPVSPTRAPPAVVVPAARLQAPRPTWGACYNAGVAESCRRLPLQPLH
jgi:hypothetical protein